MILEQTIISPLFFAPLGQYHTARVIQSYAASIVNRAALQINRKFRKENIVGQVIAQIHDQLICQVKIEDVKRACEIVQDCMENTTKLDGVELIAIPEVANNFKDGH